MKKFEIVFCDTDPYDALSDGKQCMVVRAENETTAVLEFRQDYSESSALIICVREMD